MIETTQINDEISQINEEISKITKEKENQVKDLVLRKLQLTKEHCECFKNEIQSASWTNRFKATLDIEKMRLILEGSIPDHWLKYLEKPFEIQPALNVKYESILRGDSYKSRLVLYGEVKELTKFVKKSKFKGIYFDQQVFELMRELKKSEK